MADFFGERSPFQNFFDEEMSGPAMQQQTSIHNSGPQMSQQININVPSGSRVQNTQIFDRYFRPFSFTSIFNDAPMMDMSQSFSQFNPHEFGMNYNQNFRSSMPRRRARPAGAQAQSNANGGPGLGFFRHGGGGPQGQNVRFMAFDDFVNLLGQQMQEEQEQQNRRPTDQEFIARLPVVTIEEKHCKKLEDGSLEKPTCSVCITDFDLGSKGLFLPCGHTFHPDCIKPWLQDHNTCPVCRKELPSNQ